MPFSVTYKGKVEDIAWVRRPSQPDRYLAYLGNTVVCECFKMSRRRWSVVVIGDHPLPASTMRLVNGFSTRVDALIYALYATGIWRKNYE